MLKRKIGQFFLKSLLELLRNNRLGDTRALGRDRLCLRVVYAQAVGSAFLLALNVIEYRLEIFGQDVPGAQLLGLCCHAPAYLVIRAGTKRLDAFLDLN